MRASLFKPRAFVPLGLTCEMSLVLQEQFHWTYGRNWFTMKRTRKIENLLFFCLVYVWLPGCHDHATDFSRGGVSRIYAWLCCFFWTLIEISLTSLKTLWKAHHFFSLLLSTPSSSRYFYIFCLNRCNQASNDSKWHTIFLEWKSTSENIS